MPEVNRQRTTCQKLTETAALILTWISLGMYLEIFGPTLKDLILRLDSNYEQLAFAISGRTIGWILGSILGGFLVDRLGLYRHLIITLALLAAAISTATIPWLPNITTVWIFCFIGGVCEQTVNIAGTSVTLSIWKEHAASSLILLHMGYGIGAFIVPLYVYPFLAERSPLTKNMTTLSPEMANTPSHHNDSVFLDSMIRMNDTSEYSLENESELYFSGDHDSSGQLNRNVYDTSQEGVHNEFMITKESKIEYAYAIAATSLAICSATFLFYQIKESKFARREYNTNVLSSYNVKRSKKHENKETSFLKMINPASCADGRFWYGLKIFVLIFLFMGNVGGCERMIGSFIRSFAIDQLEFSSVDSSLLNTSFWISFSIGRLVFALVAKWVSVRILIIIETLGVALFGALLNIFATNNSTAFWILIQPIGFLGAPLWPTGVAFTDYHVKLTGVGMTIQILGASAGGIVHLHLIGYLYETYGPLTFLYQLVGSGCLGLIIAISLDSVGAKHGNRYEMTKEQKRSKTRGSYIDICMSDE